MELDEIQYNYIMDLTKFFVDKYATGEIRDLNLIDRNVIALAPFISSFSHTFDESIWPPDKPEWYKNLIDFKVQLSNRISYLPFRLLLNKGFEQKPILLIPGTFTWNWENTNK